jgi:hypothetical protein
MVGTKYYVKDEKWVILLCNIALFLK